MPLSRILALRGLPPGSRIYLTHENRHAERIAEELKLPCLGPEWQSEHFNGFFRAFEIAVVCGSEKGEVAEGQKWADQLIDRAGRVKLLALEEGVGDWLDTNEAEMAAIQLEQRAREAEDHVDPIGIYDVFPFEELDASAAHWLWPPYIPKGFLTLIDGNSGDGKSWVLLSLAALVTQGERAPCEEVRFERGTVVYIGLDDDPSRVTVPRFKRMGGDCERAFFVGESKWRGPKGISRGTPNIAFLQPFERLLATYHPDLVILETLTDFLGGVDINDATKIQPALRRLSQLVARYDCALVASRHLSKGGKERAVFRGLGSATIIGKARSVLMVGRAPTDREERALVHLKCNLLPEGPSLGFSIDEGDGLLHWSGISDLRAEDLVAPEPKSEFATKLEKAKKFIIKQIEEAGGQIAEPKLNSMAPSSGISSRTLRRAKRTLESEDLLRRINMSGTPFLSWQGE
jgi:hypothetical protein